MAVTSKDLMVGDPGIVRVKVTRSTIVRGCHTDVGTVLTIDRREARALFAAGKAVPCADAPEPPMVREPIKADPGKHEASNGPACVKCGQDLEDRRRKRVESESGLLCGACAKE